MNERQYSVKISSPFIWRKRNLFSTSQFIFECRFSISQRLSCMTFIIITWKWNTETTVNFWWLIQIH